jgi:hypothetical protein
VPRDKRSHNNREGCQARWNKIGGVVQSCSDAAEAEVTFLSMPDHRIERIHGLVSEGQWDSTGREIREGRNDPIAEAFGYRFYHGADDLRLIKAFGIPAYDHRQACACPSEFT